VVTVTTVEALRQIRKRAQRKKEQEMATQSWGDYLTLGATASSSTSASITTTGGWHDMNTGGYLPDGNYGRQQQLQEQYNREAVKQLEYLRPPPVPEKYKAWLNGEWDTERYKVLEPAPLTALAWLDSEIDRVRVRL
jgi:hypothetical protein